jgi:hypothetical protein
LSRRLVILCGLAAALGLAATLMPGADDDTAVVDAAPRSSGPRPAQAAAAADRKSASVAPGTSPVAATPGAAQVIKPREPDRVGPSRTRGDLEPASGQVAAGGPLRTTLRASADLFPSPPAAPVVAAPPPPPPPPPPAPRPRFVLIGKIVDADGPTAIMRQGEQVLTLRPGDRSGGFRMTVLDDEAATFLHEASGSTSRIALGDASSAARGRGRPDAAPAQTEEEAPSAD